MARREKESKYTNITGLWESKKKGLFTGRCKGEYLTKFLDKIEEADGEDLVFFLWENDKESRNSADFNLQFAVNEERDDEKPRRGRDRDEETEEEEESKPRSSRDRGGRNAAKSKKSRDDW